MLTSSNLPLRAKDLNAACRPAASSNLARKPAKFTPEDFFSAWRKRDMTTVEAILARGLDLKGSDDLNLLSQATTNGDDDLVKMLLKRGANPNDAWYLAAKKGHAAIVTALFVNGADIQQTESGGQTALHAASANGHVDVVELLLEAGCDVSAECHQGYTPLLLAAGKGHNRVAKRLLEKSDPNHGGKEPPLFMASKRGYETMVRLLITHGADIDNCFHDGITPLQIAVMKGHKKVLETLIKAGANVNHVTTLLHIAVHNRDEVILKRLLRAGANPNAADSCRRSALHEACRNGSKIFVKILLEKGANSVLLDENDKSPIDYAKEHEGLDTLFNTSIDNEVVTALKTKLQALKVE